MFDVLLLGDPMPTARRAPPVARETTEEAEKSPCGGASTKIKKRAHRRLSQTMP
jgi:hypothetical protein